MLGGWGGVGWGAFMFPQDGYSHTQAEKKRKPAEEHVSVFTSKGSCKQKKNLQTADG